MDCKAVCRSTPYRVKRPRIVIRSILDSPMQHAKRLQSQRRERHRRRSVGWGMLAVLLGGCAGQQSAVDPAGSQARHILQTGEYFFWVCLLVYVIVSAVLVRTLCRSRGEMRPWDLTPDLKPAPHRETQLKRTVSAAVMGTAVLLFLLLSIDLVAARAVASLGGADELTIEVIGRQWWWEVRYEDNVSSQIITTANEIHIPTGRTVRLRLKSADVIHSFWAPNFHGKRDLIPGHETSLRIRADRTGTFFGQCAEFCGLQHALMRFVVVVESPEDFERWQEQQRAPAADPATDEERLGREVFLSTSCSMCHAVRGTDAYATIGPDLTHFGSRRSVAAGWLPNTPGHVGGWIIDPQQIKPGARMPQHDYSPEHLRALLAYLESLQ